MKGKTILCAMVAVAAVASCGGPSVAPQPDAPDGGSAARPTAVNHAAVYAAMLRHYLQDAAVDGSIAPVLYALDKAHSEAGDPVASHDRSYPIPQNVQVAVTRKLADLTRVQWVASSDDVVTHEASCARVRRHTAVVTLDVVPSSGDHLKMGIGVFSGCLAGVWQNYTLRHGGARWHVTGTAGPVSMS